MLRRRERARELSLSEHVVLNRKVVGLKARGLIWPIIYSDSIAMHRPSKQGLKVNLTMRIIESLS